MRGPVVCADCGRIQSSPDDVCGGSMTRRERRLLREEIQDYECFLSHPPREATFVQKSRTRKEVRRLKEELCGVKS